ncbi:unnamed protein product, partial [Brassica oleracea var. botrytis]
HKFEFCAVDTCAALPKCSDSLTWQSDGLYLKIGLNRVAFSTIAGSPSTSGLGRSSRRPSDSNCLRTVNQAC